MKLVVKFALWVSGIVGVVVLLFFINLAAYRLRGPSDAQEAAVASANKVLAKPTAGENAYPLTWLMRYDVADDDIEAITAEDVRKAEAMIAAGQTLAKLNSEERPRLPEPEKEEAGLCQAKDDGCLARVLADPEATRAALVQYPRTLARAHLLENKQSYRTLLPITLYTPVPNFGSLQRLRLSELALTWSDGDRVEALAGVCRNVASWRIQRRDTDSLIYSMVSVAYANDAIRLFGDMLSEFPAQQPLPDDCGTAFATIVAADVSLCSEMVGGWRMGSSAMELIGKPEMSEDGDSEQRRFSNYLFPLVFSKQQTLAWGARATHSRFCADDVVQNALQDRLLEVSPMFIAPLECASNFVGCILNNIAAPAYDDYQRRLLDAAAHLRLAATLIWLRETQADPRPVAERFANRPAHLHSGERASGISENGRSIWVDNLFVRHNARFTLALPVAVGE